MLVVAISLQLTVQWLFLWPFFSVGKNKIELNLNNKKQKTLFFMYCCISQDYLCLLIMLEKLRNVFSNRTVSLGCKCASQIKSVLLVMRGLDIWIYHHLQGWMLIRVPNCSLVAPSNPCSTLPFLPFSVGQGKTSETDSGQPREIGSSIFRLLCCENFSSNSVTRLQWYLGTHHYLVPGGAPSTKQLAPNTFFPSGMMLWYRRARRNWFWEVWQVLGQRLHVKTHPVPNWTSYKAVEYQGVPVCQYVQ